MNIVFFSNEDNCLSELDRNIFQKRLDRVLLDLLKAYNVELAEKGAQCIFIEQRDGNTSVFIGADEHGVTTTDEGLFWCITSAYQKAIS